jgi:YbgC/YbaW family acyl-CoA thioester hydrolase
MFYEVDSAGIVHFSNYFRYMEEAEHALWREAGLSIAARDVEFGFPRVAAGFDYHKPLHFEDEFDVRIRITAISERKIQYTCALIRGADAIATGTLTIVCVSRRPNEPMKSTRIPADVAARLAVFASPGS